MWGANAGEWGGSFCGWGANFSHGFWGFSWLFPLLFWGLMAYLALSVIRHIFPGKQAVLRDGSLEILRNRFAAGEIDEQEYSAQKAVLEKN